MPEPRSCRWFFQLEASLVLGHPRRVTHSGFAIQLAHTELEVVQIRGFSQVSVATLFGHLVSGLRQEQEQAAKKEHDQPRKKNLGFLPSE
jgi:hypothetical protein